MELAADRTQADAFHASFQAFFEKCSCSRLRTVARFGITLLNWTV